MYFPYFITYMAAGLAIALIAFFWALHHGQFRDQNRARFLALEPEAEPTRPQPSRFVRYEIYALFFLAAAGIAASAAVLGFALYSNPGP